MSRGAEHDQHYSESSPIRRFPYNIRAIPGRKGRKATACLKRCRVCGSAGHPNVRCPNGSKHGRSSIPAIRSDKPDPPKIGHSRPASPEKPPKSHKSMGRSSKGRDAPLVESQRAEYSIRTPHTYSPQSPTPRGHHGAPPSVNCNRRSQRFPYTPLHGTPSQMSGRSYLASKEAL